MCRPNVRLVGLCAVIAGALLLDVGSAARAQPVFDSLELERGARVYRAHCAACHGRRGDGRGPVAYDLDPAPRDFTRGVYKWRSTPSGALPTNADLLRSVRRGAPGTSMPAWAGRVPDTDIRAVVSFIKRFSTRFDRESTPSPAVLPRSVPVFDANSRRRGRAMYVLMQCWTCHGVRGDGDGPAAATLVDDRGRPIDAYDFTLGTFRSGNTPRDVFRTFTTGVDGTPMPAYEDALLVGNDSFTDLTALRPALGANGAVRLRAWLASMPSTEALSALSETERARRSARARWDLVSFVVSLSQGNRVWRWLTSPPYLSP